MSWIDSLKSLLVAIKDLLPTIAAYILGKNKADKEKVETEVKLEGAELELEKKKNKEIIEEINKGLDDRSIVRRAIIKGRNLLSKNKTNLL